MFKVLDALDARGMADALDVNARATLGRQAWELVAVAGWADLHNEDSVATDGHGRVLAGMEHAKAYGGDGTPWVAEFATAELGPLLGRSVGSADALLRDALDLRHRHPRLWARLEDTARLAALPGPAITGHPVSDTITELGDQLAADLGLEAVVPVPTWQARRVAQACHTAGLSLDQARRVDELTSPLLGCLPWARFERLLATAVIEADPDAAKARADADAQRQGVTLGPSTELGLMTMFIKARAGDVILGNAMVNRLAQLLALDGDTGPLGVRQARAATLLMGNPYQAVALLLKYATHTDHDDADDEHADCGDAGDTDGASPEQRGTGVAPRGHGDLGDLGDLADLADLVDQREPDYREVVLDPPNDAPAPPPQTPPDDDFLDPDYPGPDFPAELALPPGPPDTGDPWTGPAPPDTRDPALAEQEPATDVLSTWDIHPCANDADDPDTDVERSGVPADAAAAHALLAAVRAGKINPDKLFPTTTLYVHLSAHALWHALHPDTPDDAIGADTACGAACGNAGPCPYCAAGESVPAAVRAEGRIGPILAGQARDWLHHARVTVRPVIDLNVNHAVDCYEVPAWIAEALHLANPGSCFPHAPSTSRRVDHDHTIPYAKHADGTPVAAGQTRLDNLGKLQRHLHRVKTHKPGWRVYQPERGVYLWRSPHGHWYRVDNTGTHRLGTHPDLSGYHLTDADKPDSAA